MSLSPANDFNAHLFNEDRWGFIRHDFGPEPRELLPDAELIYPETDQPEPFDARHYNGPTPPELVEINRELMRTQPRLKP